MTLGSDDFLGPWIRATWGGWVLGVPLIAGFALVGEAVGAGGKQVFVGAGIGAGVGLLQARVVRRLGVRGVSWFVASIAGLMLGFLGWDAARLRGIDVPLSMLMAVAAGGLCAGLFQARLLPSGWPRLPWVIASGVGWTIAGTLALGADRLSHQFQLRGVPGALFYLGLVAVGGLVLGIVTGVVLEKMAVARTRRAQVLASNRDHPSTSP